MTPQEIIEILGIDIGDPPPWDGDIVEISASVRLMDDIVKVTIIDAAQFFYRTILVIRKKSVLNEFEQIHFILKGAIRDITFMY